MSYYIISYHITLHHIVSYRIKLWYIISYYIILYLRHVLSVRCTRTKQYCVVYSPFMAMEGSVTLSLSLSVFLSLSPCMPCRCDCVLPSDPLEECITCSFTLECLLWLLSRLYTLLIEYVPLCLPGSRRLP